MRFSLAIASALAVAISSQSIPVDTNSTAPTNETPEMTQNATDNSSVTITSIANATTISTTNSIAIDPNNLPTANSTQVVPSVTATTVVNAANTTTVATAPTASMQPTPSDPSPANLTTEVVSQNTTAPIVANATEAPAVQPTASNELPYEPTTQITTPTPAPVSAVYINEIQNKNMDWIELFNEGNTSVNLAGYTLVYDGDVSEAYSFRGDCGVIEANTYLMLVKDEVTNPEYTNGDCMLPFGIKSSGELSLFNANNTLLDSTSWVNTAYVAGHSWARKSGKAELGAAEWAPTSSNTWRRPNVFTEEITIPTTVDFSQGLHDRAVAYVQDPPRGSITNVHLRVHTSSDSCTCNKYNDEPCTCTWDDIQNDETGSDTYVPTMPCSVAIDVDGEKEYGFDAQGNQIDYDNCVVHLRGGYTRSSDLKSYTIKMDKTTVPREWRGNKRLTMVKHPWTFSRVEVPLFSQQFREMEDFHSLKTIIANLTVTYVDPITEEVVGVENMGGYTMYENSDEDMLDRHGLSSQTVDGDRKESWLYKLRAFTWEYTSVYDQVVPVADETNEELMATYEYRLENKDSDDNTKLVQTIYELNGMVPNVTFVEAVQKRFDMNNLAQWMAINLVCGDIDHQGKNAYIYSNSDSDLWYYTPWDYDACLKPVMDHGPPSLTSHRYQDDYFFQGIMHYPELRDVFWPLLKQKINYIRYETGFQRDALWEAALEFANWTDPFLQEGLVDREILFQHPWTFNSELNLTWDAEIVDYNMAPRDLLFGQYDFVQDQLDIFVGLDYPPNVYSELWLAENNDETSDERSFVVESIPFTSPIGNPLEITYQVYTGRPSEEEFEQKEYEFGDGLFDHRYFDPEVQDAEIIFESTISNEWDRNYTDLFHDKVREFVINCGDVEECGWKDCWISAYTTDTETNIRSAAGCTEDHVQLDYDRFC